MERSEARAGLYVVAGIVAGVGGKFAGEYGQNYLHITPAEHVLADTDQLPEDAIIIDTTESADQESEEATVYVREGGEFRGLNGYDKTQAVELAEAEVQAARAGEDRAELIGMVALPVSLLVLGAGIAAIRRRRAAYKEKIQHDPAHPTRRKRLVGKLGRATGLESQSMPLEP